MKKTNVIKRLAILATVLNLAACNWELSDSTGSSIEIQGNARDSSGFAYVEGFSDITINGYFAIPNLPVKFNCKLPNGKLKLLSNTTSNASGGYNSTFDVHSDCVSNAGNLQTAEIVTTINDSATIVVNSASFSCLTDVSIKTPGTTVNKWAAAVNSCIDKSELTPTLGLINTGAYVQVTAIGRVPKRLSHDICLYFTPEVKAKWGDFCN